MAESIKCPACGESNQSDQEFCQFCQYRLRPLTGSLKELNETLKPGQIPTKKNTSELEPILPQWLRDARSSAQKISEEDATLTAKQPQESQSPSSGVDLLAGLHSQSQDNDEEDTPEWLTSITGETPKPRKAQAELSEVRWVELGAKDDFPQGQEQSAPKSGAPSWLAELDSSTPKPNEKDELADWFRDANNASKPEEQKPPFFTEDNSFSSSPNDAAPDWLKAMAEENGENKDNKPFDSNANITPSSVSSDIPDWLHVKAAEDILQDDNSLPINIFDSAPISPDAPDWLNGPSEATAPASPFEQDWMKDLQAGDSAQPIQGDTPVWLKADVPEEGTAVPPWLSDLPASAGTESMQDQPPAAVPEQEEDAEFGDVPGWLKAAAPQSSIFEEPDAELEASARVEPFSDSPDWLNTFKPDATSGPQPVPAFIDNSQPSGETDALFTDMPDWLSNADDVSSSSSSAQPITGAESLTPGNLPSWVQAMRPVDSGIPQPVSASYSSDQTLESRGALAGLQGVLPMVPGFTPTSKPKAYSIKLQASEEQQAHAVLLEQILAAETEPVPLTSFSVLASARGLRWLLAIVLITSLATVLMFHTQIFAMPVGLPTEVVGALQVAQSIPDSAPVLVAIDYVPARAGEMETTAAPLFDQMLLLHHPRLTFISSGETGAILTEHFISGPLGGHNYRSGVEYLNLGYLPGGQMGMYAFALDPRKTTEFAFSRDPVSNALLDMTLIPAWTSEPWSNITSLSQFAAFIIITDDADSTRAWIEQTTPTRGTIPVVVISSSQASPLIQPYYASQQISGMVSGLYGGALFEQNNAGRPGTARTYWDAYSIGMLLAVVLIICGGLWNLVLGLRDRSAARETK